MAENALDLAAGAVINLGSPSGLDDLASPFTVMGLFRFDTTPVPNSTLLIGKNGGSEGWNLWYEDATTIGFSRNLSTAACYYDARSAAATAASTWYWMAAGYDQAAGAVAKVQVMRGVPGGSMAAWGTMDGNNEGSGSIATDASNSIRINDTSWFGGTGGDVDVAAIGIVSGKKSPSEIDAILANVQGASWLGLWGKPTATGAFPLLLGTAANIANGTTSGTIALASDAPDWYTSAAAGYDPTLLTRRRSTLLSL